MALPSTNDPRSNGQDTPTPIPARGSSIPPTEFPRLPRFVILRRWQATTWALSYLAVVTVCVILATRLATR